MVLLLRRLQLVSSATDRLALRRVLDGELKFRHFCRLSGVSAVLRWWWRRDYAHGLMSTFDRRLGVRVRPRRFV